MAPEREEDVDELLDDLEAASRKPAKQRATKITSLIDSLCSKAAEEGLSSSSLGRLVEVITLPNQLDQGSLNVLVGNLYPSSKISDTVIIKVVNSLGHGRVKPSYSIQAVLLKWIVMIYDVLENPRILSQLYSILFNLLDTVAIRPQLCHVLSLITQRKHVRPFRIQALMELTRQAGNEPPLVGLMRVFKDYYPDVIVSDVTSGRASVFTHPNREWRQRLSEIQETHFQKTQDGLPPQLRTFRIARKSGIDRGRNGILIVPEVHTFQAHESSVTLEEIENVHDFVWKLEKIELPNQLVAVIGDPLLQKLLQLRSQESGANRVDHWLMAFFEDQLNNTDENDNAILEMLSTILTYTRSTKNLPSVCLSYLTSMLPSWNGTTGREIVLDLLAYVALRPFEELYASIFQNLEEAMLQDGTTESQLLLLSFYSNILNEWTSSLLSQPHPSPSSRKELESLLNHANNLALTILQSSTTLTTQSTVLTFYESISTLITYPSLQEVIYISLPPASLIHTLQFTSSLPILSRLCSILAHYKRAFEIATDKNKSAYPKDYINVFNGFLMDVCNCLWRAKAFTTSDLNSVGCSLPQAVTYELTNYISTIGHSLTLMSLFTFSFSPVFSLLAIEYVRELEDAAADDIEKRHAGPVTQKTLVQLEKDGGLRLPFPDYKLGVLRHIEKKGIVGVGELMYNTMKHLMSSKPKP